MELLILALALGQDVKKVVEAPETREPLPYKVDFSYLEKTYGLTTRNFELVTNGNGRKMAFLVEHGRDLTDAELAEVKTMFGRFDPRKPNDTKPRKVRLMWIDADGVIASSTYLGNVLVGGEITGTKGDSFRAVVDYHPAALTGTPVRVEMRPLERPKVTSKEEKK